MARGIFDLAHGESTPNAAAACLAIARTMMRINELAEKQFPDFFEAMIKVMSAR